MTLHQILRQTGFDVSESTFPDNYTPTLPFILWEDAGSSDFHADNKPYAKIRTKDVRICNDGKRPDSAARVALESVLEDNGIPYKLISGAYIEKERMYETLYEITVKP